ncbi:hypothetical protein WG68_12135 [Arsukibacterium ikkense]|uniref:HTH cro/C1-type domain-containing protein n=1 Tax=Arsukibacterium ikkense TaxID=336831 RepID=A0A0M2V444_9GAMM|nr:helix-turn-helix transcriptional regulator [Arsukibacterium ikkense]KKO45169.1 hypothetical protein WG68_12135 [Arsukibacterium ikkense]
MDMKINRDVLTQARSARAWSQQQLADVAGLSLRTIQRIEKSGVASNDSLQGICAAFNKEPRYFIAHSEQPAKQKNLVKIGLGIMTAALLILGSTYFSWVSAETIVLNIEYRGEHLATGDLNEVSLEYLVDIGRTAELPLPNDFMLVIRPQNTKDGVTLDVTLKSASSQSLIPNGHDLTVTRPLADGVNIKYEKAGSFLANVMVRVN